MIHMVTPHRRSPGAAQPSDGNEPALAAASTDTATATATAIATAIAAATAAATAAAAATAHTAPAAAGRGAARLLPCRRCSSHSVASSC